MENPNKNIKKFKNIKELLYNSVSKYPNNIAFTSKIKEGTTIKYINHTYSNFLEDINSFGTSLYKLGLQNKRVAIIGYNCYEWAVSHLANLLRWFSFCTFG